MEILICCLIFCPYLFFLYLEDSHFIAVGRFLGNINLLPDFLSLSFLLILGLGRFAALFW
jgi:hypothetical protein